LLLLMRTRLRLLSPLLLLLLMSLLLLLLTLLLLLLLLVMMMLMLMLVLLVLMLLMLMLVLLVLLLLSMLLLMEVLMPLVLPRLLLLRLLMLLLPPLLLPMLPPPEGPRVLRVLPVLLVLRGPQGERNGDVVVCSRMRSTMGNMIRTGGGENETRRSTASEQVSGRQGRSNMKRERKRKGPMSLMPPSGHTPPQGGGGAGAVRGGQWRPRQSPRQTAQ